MIKVDYARGGSYPVLRHNAHTFVYMLERSVVMQMKGEKEVMLTPGQTFYEDPNPIHVVSRTQAAPSQPNSWFSLLRTRALRC